MAYNRTKDLPTVHCVRVVFEILLELNVIVDCTAVSSCSLCFPTGVGLRLGNLTGLY